MSATPGPPTVPPTVPPTLVPPPGSPRGSPRRSPGRSPRTDSRIAQFRARGPLSRIRGAALIFVPLAISALFIGWLVSRAFGGGSAAKPPEQTSVTVSRSSTKTKPDPQRPATSTSSKEPIETIRIEPQRSPAPLNRQLQLDIRGEGCIANSTGVLSMHEIGSAAAAGDDDRLVLRRRFDTGADGNWASNPVLVGQPVGSYLVSASCQRRASALNAVDTADRAEVFTVTDVLELTGPAVSPSFLVRPRLLRAGQANTITVQGGQCFAADGRSGQVEVALVPFVESAWGTANRVESRFNGDWVATLVVPSQYAQGTYSVIANCLGGRTYGSTVARFSTEEDLAATKLIEWYGRPTTPSVAVKGRPNFTG